MGGGGQKAMENKPKATHAWNVEDMNETQLEREIAKYERWTNASQKQVNNIQNSASMRNFNDLMEQFPGGVGGSAVNARYRKMVDRYDNAMGKLIENQNKLASRSERLERLRTAYEQVKGTGMTQRQVQKAGAEANVRKMAGASKLGSGWKSGSEDARNYMYNSGTVKTYTNGDFKIVHNWQRYELFIKGKSVGRYMTLKKAKEMAESR